jgi:hypothetical protein
VTRLNELQNYFHRSTYVTINIKNKKTMVQKTEDNKTALIIIDIQNDYFPGGTMELASADDTAAKAANVLSYFRKEEMPVIHVQHRTSRRSYFYPIQKVLKSISMTPLKTEKVITKNFQIVLETQNY